VQAIPISAKTGFGTDKIIPALLKSTPAPKGSRDKPLRVLLFDSWYVACTYYMYAVLVCPLISAPLS